MTRSFLTGNSMRWSIRNQLLVPLVAIQVIAVAAITLTTATLAARRSERQIIDRVNGVLDTLEHADFPYTGSVLTKMRGLSGAHFVACDESGRVSESTLLGLRQVPPDLHSLPRAAYVDSLGARPAAILGGMRFFGVMLRSSRAPRNTSLLVLYPESSWRQARWEAALPPLLLGIGSLGVMVLFTCWIAHRFSTRIERLGHQVARIVEGDFQELTHSDERDEVGDLSRSINRLCGRLRDMRRTIRQTERSRLLSQFAAGMAHQLRNALTGARISVQLHAKRYPVPDDDECLSVALRQLAMTEEQVKGLLSLGRVEPRAPAVFDLVQLVSEVAALVQPTCRHARVALGDGQNHERIEILGDQASVRAAVLNLALNAIEAAGAGGRVGLEAFTEGDLAVIEVVDTGAGPAPEVADALCEAFVTNKPEGVGLGLAIAQQVASEHHGRLSWLRASGETRFRLSLRNTIASPKGAA
jgi:signal transduction histidine kinase